jgi:hypothetical protein
VFGKEESIDSKAILDLLQNRFEEVEEKQIVNMTMIMASNRRSFSS